MYLVGDVGAVSIKDGMRQVRGARIMGYFVFVATTDEVPKLCNMIGQAMEF